MRLGLLRLAKVLVLILFCTSCISLVCVFVQHDTSIPISHPVATERKIVHYNVLLRSMGYPMLRSTSQVDQKDLQRFFSSVQGFAISDSERQIFLELLSHFQHFCAKNKLVFFLFYGGLLGAYRHHGFIPWDDDLDVMMPLSSKSLLQVLLEEDAVLGGAEKHPFVVVVFLRDLKKSGRSSGRSWSWPYIEVHFYEHHRGQLLHHFLNCGASEEDDVFPLIYVPFENVTVPAPRRMDCLVRQCYENADIQCCTNVFDHRRDLPSTTGGHCIKCKVFESIFPFVSSRRRNGEYVEEEVRLNGSLVAKRHIKKPNCRKPD